MAFTRRGFVVAGLAGTAISQSAAGYAAADPGRHESRAEPGSAAVTVETLQSAAVTTYGPDFTTAHTVTIPTLVRLSSEAGVPSGAVLAVEYDSRVLCDTPAVLLDGGRAAKLAATIATGDAGRAVATLTLPHAIGAGSASVYVVLPLAIKDLFPAENVGRPADVILQVSDGPKVVVRTTVSRTADAGPVQPWGLNVVSGWASIDLGGGHGARTYRVPSTVRVASTGPFAIPGGAALTVEADANVVSQLAVAEVRLGSDQVAPSRYRSVPSEGDGVVRTQVLFGEELAAGSELVVRFDVSPRAAAAIGEGIVFARAYATASPSALRPERLTGSRMTVALTDSGQPLAASDAVGKV